VANVVLPGGSGMSLCGCGVAKALIVIGRWGHQLYTLFRCLPRFDPLPWSPPTFALLRMNASFPSALRYDGCARV
jgi:hypothetical protein